MATLKNNARGFLAAPVSESSTVVTLVSGLGAVFPDTSAGGQFFCTLVSADARMEIVQVTSRDGDEFTVVRGQEGTVPQSFDPGSLFELRVTVGNVQKVVDDAIDGIDPVFRDFRPGDAPRRFVLTGGEVTSGLNGGVYRMTGTARAEFRNSVPFEDGRAYTLRGVYQRFRDSGDPSNDGITAGIDWYNGFDVKVGTAVIHTDLTLLVASQRRQFEYSVGFGGGPVYDVYIPEGARYGVPWFRTFGGEHETDLVVLQLSETVDPTPLTVTPDQIILPPDFQWPAGTIPAGAGVSDPYIVNRTFYVTMGGNDANDGTSLSVPVATVGRALELAAGEGVPCAVIVHPGEYTVQPDTVIPANCALYGYDLRVTKLRLPNGLSQNNMFLMNSGIKVRGFTFANLEHESPPGYPDFSTALTETEEWGYFTVDGQLYRNEAAVARPITEHDYPPQKGFAFAFNPGAFITRSPYIADCSVLHELTYDQMTAPMDRANGNPEIPKTGGNLIADGSVLAPSSPLRSVVVDSFTAINPNGYGYLMRRNAFVQLVSVFTNWSRYGLWCHDGGQVTVANSNNTFGDYALVSTGFRQAIRIEDPVGEPRDQYPAAAAAILEELDNIVNESYALLADEFVEVQNFTLEQEQFTRRDTATLLRELAGDFRSGQDAGTQFFIKGLFDWNAQYVFDPALLPIFIRSFQIIEERIVARCSLVAPATNMLSSLINLIIACLENPPRIPFPSVIEATGQQFSYVGAGVNYGALPFSQRGTGLAGDPTLVNLRVDGGRIYATFSTEVGDTYLGDDLRVDFERGTVEGQAFSRGVQNITLPLIVALGG